MLVTVHLQNKQKNIEATDIKQLRTQIVLAFYLEFFKLGHSKEDSYKLAARETGYAATYVKEIVLKYIKED